MFKLMEEGLSTCQTFSIECCVWPWESVEEDVNIDVRWYRNYSERQYVARFYVIPAKQLDP